MTKQRALTADDVEELTDLVTIMIENLIDDVDALKLRVSRNISTITFEFDVAEPDVGPVFGSQGRNLAALAHVAHVAARRRGCTVVVNFLRQKVDPFCKK